MRKIISEKVSLRLGDKWILKDVSLEARRGGIIGLIGPNGSGKSTWLRALSGLLPYDQGSIQIDGKEITTYAANQMARLIGYVPQDTSLEFDFLVRDVVLMGRHAHIPRFGLESTRDFAIAEEAMQRTHITHLADQSAIRLSGGQRQMVFIAKALAQESDILIFDEPTSALDINRQLQVLELIKSLTHEGVTVIMALHDLNLAARFCDQLVLLKNGRVLASGNPEDVLSAETIQESYGVSAAIRYDPIINAQYITALRYEST